MDTFSIEAGSPEAAAVRAALDTLLVAADEGDTDGSGDDDSGGEEEDGGEAAAMLDGSGQTAGAKGPPGSGQATGSTVSGTSSALWKTASRRAKRAAGISSTANGGGGGGGSSNDSVRRGGGGGAPSTSGGLDDAEATAREEAAEREEAAAEAAAAAELAVLHAHAAAHLAAALALSAAACAAVLCAYVGAPRAVATAAALLVGAAPLAASRSGFAAVLTREQAPRLSTSSFTLPPAAPRIDATLYAALAAHALLLCAAVPACLHAVALALPGRGGAAASLASDDAHVAYFWALHAPLGVLAWLLAALPPRLVWFPELCRCAAYALAALRCADNAADAWLVAAHALGCAALTPMVLTALAPPVAGVESLLSGVDTCPPPLRSMRDAALDAVARARAHAFGSSAAAVVPLLDTPALMALAAHAALLAARGALGGGTAPSLLDAARQLRLTLLLLTVAAAAARLLAARARASDGGVKAADAAAAVALGSARQIILRELRSRIAAARSEAAVLAAGAAALRPLFPGCAAAAVGAFAEGAGCEVLAALEVNAADASVRAALHSALPSCVGAGTTSSIARTCRAKRGAAALLLDSAELPGGVAECADWAAAAAATAAAAGAGAAAPPVGRCVTASLTAGPLVVGFLQLYFRRTGAEGPGFREADAALHELAQTVAGAIFVRRAFATNQDAFNAAAAAAAAVTPVVSSTSRLSIDSGGRASEAGPFSGGGDPSTLPYPASEADAAALADLDERAGADRMLLNTWSLDAWAFPEEELLRLLAAQLHSLGLLRRFHISPTAFAAFAADVASHYDDNPCAPHRLPACVPALSRTAHARARGDMPLRAC
jgi:hypothetical protein